MNTNNKVPWTDLLSELRNRDKRWEKLLCAKFNPLRDEIKQMENQITQICELSADNENRIGGLETTLAIAKATRKNCQTQAELKIKKWHVWAIVIAASIAAAAAVMAAVL
jgi:uncharacterized protein YdcH (DUF465 family)